MKSLTLLLTRCQGGLVGEEAAISTMMLSYGCMGLVTLLWSWIGVRQCAHFHVTVALHSSASTTV